MPRVSTEEQSMTSTRKAAAFLVAIGEETAAEVYKHLSEEEVEAISLEMARIDVIDQQSIDEIMKEFYELFVTQKAIAEGGTEYSMNVLTNAFGKEKAKELMERIKNSNRAFEFLKNVDYKNILTLLQNEMPQTIALVLAHISSKKSAQIVAEFPHEVQVDLFKRIAELDSISPEVIKNVEAMISDKLNSVVSVDTVAFGGVNYLADVMNNLDVRTEKSIIEGLGEYDPELADEIQKRMFVFEDIVTLDSREIQTLLKACDTKDITVALKGAEANVKKVIFSNMSQRQQETIQTDLQYLHNVRMRDVEEAQGRIIATVRRLEESGEIIMSKGGLDEIIP